MFNRIKRLTHQLTSNDTNKNYSALFYKIFFISIFAAAMPAQADEQSEKLWQGEWQAEDTDFSLRVTPAGSQFYVEPIWPTGLGWKASNGVINGKSGTINVEYQGVTARVMVQLINQDNAIVRSLSCQPDYHVICTLVRNQQAHFIKQQP